MLVPDVFQFYYGGRTAFADGTYRASLNSLGYRFDPPDAGLPYPNGANWWNDFVRPWNGVFNLLAHVWDFEGVALRHVWPAPGAAYSAAIRGVGGVVDTPATPSIAVHVNLRTAQHGRAGRGFKRFGPIPLAHVDGNALTADALAQWQAAVTTLIQPFPVLIFPGITYNMQPVVWQRQEPPGADFQFATGKVADIVSADVAPILSTVRRRRAHSRPIT